MLNLIIMDYVYFIFHAGKGDNDYIRHLYGLVIFFTLYKSICMDKSSIEVRLMGLMLQVCIHMKRGNF